MYRAHRTPRFNTPAAWAEILGDYPVYPALEGSHQADVVVVGAGFAGLSAARRLVQLDPALKIIVLDALRISEGSAGRNSGFMIDLPHDLSSPDYAGAGDDKRLIALNRQAIGFARGAVADYEINPAFADPAGKVNGAASVKGEAHNHSYAAHLKGLREPSTQLDAQDMRELTGTTYYRSGLFTPGTLMLQPAGYIQGLARGLHRAGVALFQCTPVTGFEAQGAAWRVTTPAGQISTAQIILANNGHLESFGIARGKLMQLFLYASMTPELSPDQIRSVGGQSHWGITPADPMGTTVRRISAAQGGHRIITRNCATMRPEMDVSSGDIRRATRVQARKFAARFPQLAGMKMQYTWAGHLCLTLNGVSVTGEVAKGVIAACAQNGLGTARGTLTGIAAADRALGHHSDITDYFDNEAPPKPLPPQPFANIGANAYIRLKEFRARAE